MEADTTAKERDGLVEIRWLITEYLNSGEGTPEVREYISSVTQDNSMLLIYLKGRKYRVKYAWETLKRKAEVQFNEYPEVFQNTFPEFIYPLIMSGILGLLNARNKFGQRMFFFDAGKWDPDKVSLEQLTTAGAYFMDFALQDEDVMNNGLLLIQNNAGVGVKHAREHTIHAMLRLVNIFFYATPIQLKGFYYLNNPLYARYIYKLMKPFLPKKFKERLFISTTGQKFEVLHERISPQILPKFLGGIQDNENAFDLEILSKISS